MAISPSAEQEKIRVLEAALLDSQMRLRGFYDAAPLSIMQWSREGRITDWNKMAENMFGHTREKVIGEKLVPLLIHPNEYQQFSVVITNTLRTGEANQITCRSLRADGSEILCEWRNVPLRTAKGSLIGVLSLALDVTERVRAEEQLRRSRDIAEQLSQAKTEFMATISHELRTPLNGVIGMSQLLLGMISNEDEKSFVQIIDDSGKQLLNIINAILAYTEVDLKRPEEALGECNVNEIVDMIADRYRILATKKNISFDMTLDDALNVPLIGDRRALEKIISNLLDNAVRFTNDGGVAVTTHKESADKDTLIATITISDTGVGMSHDFMANSLYVPFKQAENAITRKQGGVGLGMALTKKLVDRINGTIEVASMEGAGTTFTLHIPYRIAAQPATS